ncbi:MAG: hypothetical protein ACK5V3_08690 [Bdellovibrionales bacterium]
MAGSALKVDKVQLEKAITVAQEKEEKKLFEMNNDPVDFGKADSLRYNILNWVLDEKYDRAIQELKDFANRDSEYPTFHQRVERFISHSIDLVYAIKAKRNFPGLSSLTRAKQQELREKFKEHFKELQMVLQKIEKIQIDLRIQDARSTIYIIRALWFAGASIALLAFMMEIFNGLALTSTVVFEDLLNRAVEALFTLLGL